MKLSCLGESVSTILNPHTSTQNSLAVYSQHLPALRKGSLIQPEKYHAAQVRGLPACHTKKDLKPPPQYINPFLFCDKSGAPKQGSSRLTPRNNQSCLPHVNAAPRYWFPKLKSLGSYCTSPRTTFFQAHLSIRVDRYWPSMLLTVVSHDPPLGLNQPPFQQLGQATKGMHMESNEMFTDLSDSLVQGEGAAQELGLNRFEQG